MEDASARYRVVPVVSPISNDPNTSGRVRNLHVGGGVVHKQIVRSPNSPSGWEVDPSYARAGWRLLHDCYLDEKDPEGWERYKRYLVAWQGTPTKPPTATTSFPEMWLPKCVQERRKAQFLDEFALAADEFRIKPVTGDTVPPTPRAKPAKGAGEGQS